MSKAMSAVAARQQYEEYRREVTGDQLVGSIRAAILVVVGLNIPFLLLDYSAYRENFFALFATRGLLALALGAMYFQTPRAPAKIMMPGILLAGINLVVVIGLAGGVSSLYFPGLMLLFLGMPVLLPLSARQAAIAVTILFGSYAALPLFGAGEFATTEYFLNLIFPGAAAIESVFSCALLDGLRFRDYQRRSEITAARDQLAKLDDAKTRFSANVHHELRTPLTLMLAPLDGLKLGEYGDVSEEVQRTLSTMQSNGRRLLKLINNLLDLAKLEKNEFTLVRQPADISEIVTELVDSTHAMAKMKDIQIQKIGFDSFPSVNVDRDALDKVLINLVGNALKFTERGGTIKIEGEAVQDGVLIRCVDDGIGLDEVQTTRIFDRFAQVDSSATRAHEGTGIGLSLSHELVELHGGKIWATSDGIGKGSTIHVFLPYGEVDLQDQEAVLEGVDWTSQGGNQFGHESAGGRPISDVESGRFLELGATVDRWVDQSAPDGLGEPASLCETGKPPVLVVDDNAEMRELLSFILSKEFSVRTAKNGQDALRVLESYSAKLVVTDVMMPLMSGTELCEKIKSNAATEDIAVMIVSSKAEGEMRAKGLELGADDYVTKPFHPKEILARARGLVTLRQAQDELAEKNSTLEETLAELKSTQGALVHSERLAAVGELAAGIAHEVNNPVNYSLNAVRALDDSVGELQAFAQEFEGIGRELEAGVVETGDRLRGLLKGGAIGQLGDDVRELANIAREGLVRTQRLVGDLRDFAAPRRSEEFDLIDVRECVDSTISLIAHEVSGAGIEVGVNLPEAPVVVEGDASALRQVFLNLLKNAVEAVGEMPIGGAINRRKISVEMVEIGEEVQVSVSDYGPGIPESQLEKVFEPFYSTKAPGSGSGLGLSMCRSIATEHSGRLDIVSEPRGGVRATLTLPAKSASPADS